MSESLRLIGSVSEYRPDLGIGYLALEGREKEIFFRLEGNNDLKKSQKVSFLLIKTEQGEEASEIEILE